MSFSLDVPALVNWLPVADTVFKATLLLAIAGTRLARSLRLQPASY